jgi:hypothetical protein
MRAAMLIGLLAFVTIVLGQNQAPSPPRGDWEHTLWIDGTLTAIESIEVGMSHKELDRLFAPEGGFHGGEDWVYIYKQCPYIKVNVQLANDGKISRISRPYLERPTRAAD